MQQKKKRGARLGQHFLTARRVAVSLARAVAVRTGESIVEVGPGKGALTRELVRIGGPVVAIEKDEELIGRLRDSFEPEIKSGRLRIIAGDIRDLDTISAGLADHLYVVAANIPYYITGEIIRQFLTAPTQPRAMALLIQKEVAQRITSSKESLLSLSVKVYGTPKIIEKVSRKCFSPAPSVDSAILLIDNISHDFFADVREEHFFAVMHAGFASKRKFLANNLGVKFGKEIAAKALADCGINEKARAEDVSLLEWKEIAQKLSE
jgi:16S rRNA (adenine1518-N6/adenine1519-N6)-dimethyltransferase